MQLLEPVQFQAHNQRLFDATSATLAAILPAARIEHVGSSAIAGAWSRGDLDICVIVPAAQLRQRSGCCPATAGTSSQTPSDPMNCAC